MFPTREREMGAENLPTMSELASQLVRTRVPVAPGRDPRKAFTRVVLVARDGEGICGVPEPLWGDGPNVPPPSR